MKRVPHRFIILLISILMIFAGITTAWLVQNSFGAVITKEIDLRTTENVIIHSTLQIPNEATSSNPVPGVVVIHGVYQSKEWLMAFGIELARRGFVVLTIDAGSHGNSGYTSYDSDGGGAAALEYLNNLTYVNKLGIVGHSMGAGIAIQALELTTVPVDAVVFVGGGSRSTNEWANTTFPKNLLITVGRYDELYDVPSLYTSLSDTFGVTEGSVNPGHLYGDFSNGSARKLVLGETNHLFETIDPIIISETVIWLQSSLKGIDKPLGYLIYQFHILGGLISSLGLIISVFPLIIILLDSPIFSSIRKTPSSKYAISNNKYLIFGILYAIIGLGLFLPAFMFPNLPFPQNLGSDVSIWFLGCSIVAFLLMLIIYRNLKINSVNWADFGIDFPFSKEILQQIGKSLIVSLIVILWLYVWVFPVDLILALDFRAFLPLFNDLTLKRILVIPLYLIFTIPFFIIEGIWIIGLLRPESKNKWSRTQFEWTVKAVLIKCFPYFLILMIQLIEGYILRSAYISGMIGFFLLFLWMFTPFFVISTVILAWSYQHTERVYIGAFLNALIFSWTLSSILSLAM
ncbi:MAG: alpha/beta hydrolase [Candidatus Hermodarchaeota archaeon]